MKQRIAEHIEKSIVTKKLMLEDQAFIKTIEDAIAMCVDALKDGKKILFAGNGGSAADAQHLAAELVGRYKFDRQALPSIALTTDTSALTAIGNDYGYDDVFARQVSALGNEGDIFVGISTSGNSKNVLAACAIAQEKGCKIIGFCGQKGQLKDIADLAFTVPVDETATMQEAHIMLGHILCDGIEQQLFPAENS